MGIAREKNSIFTLKVWLEPIVPYSEEVIPKRIIEGRSTSTTQAALLNVLREKESHSEENKEVCCTPLRALPKRSCSRNKSNRDLWLRFGKAEILSTSQGLLV